MKTSSFVSANEKCLEVSRIYLFCEESDERLFQIQKRRSVSSWRHNYMDFCIKGFD